MSVTYPGGHPGDYKWTIIGYRTMGASAPMYVGQTEKGVAGILALTGWALRKGAIRTSLRRGERLRPKEVVE